MTTPGALAAVLLFLGSSTVTDMSDPTRALTLDVREVPGAIEVQLIGDAPRAMRVSYELDVTGQSTSRHSGATSLAAGNKAVLSTIRVSAGAEWCVRLRAEEDGSAPYEIVKGTCAASD